eukprot:scaffold18871_cov69-Phaeocystis_antarctica.AAC.3
MGAGAGEGEAEGEGEREELCAAQVARSAARRALVHEDAQEIARGEPAGGVGHALDEHLGQTGARAPAPPHDRSSQQSPSGEGRREMYTSGVKHIVCTSRVHIAHSLTMYTYLRPLSSKQLALSSSRTWAPRGRPP